MKPVTEDVHRPSKRVASAPPRIASCSCAPHFIIQSFKFFTIPGSTAMPTIPLHPRPLADPSPTTNPLPPLLHTPSGLALLELQGTIHFPTPTTSSFSTVVGRLEFPHYNPELYGDGDTKWMKRVYFYVGENQRMAGEVKKLGKPFAVIRKRDTGDGDVVMGGDETGLAGQEELEIVEVVRYKIAFSSRPEPVGGTDEGV